MATPATLTTTDAFFVAYQERAGILMHLGAELVLAGSLDRGALEAAVGAAVTRWPALESTLARTIGGLRWRAGAHRMVFEDTEPALERWRNTPVDPFREPPFGVLWIQRSATAHVLAFRCHHAVADGMLFLAIVGEILTALASRAAPSSEQAARAQPEGERTARERTVGERAEGERTAGHPLGFAQLWRDTKLSASWATARTLAREGRADRSARVALRDETAGAIACCDRRIAAAGRAAIVERARAEEVRPAWIVAAAWLQALHAWNARRGVENATLSIEVPVSLRRGPHAMTGTGNHLTVLTLFGDAREPLGTLARSLWDDYVAAIRRRDHLAVPLFASPARLLPWPVFRRVAVTTTSTGFATSHFTWIEHDPDFRAETRERSGGALTVTDQRFYTPVCLRMGVALGVMAWPDELQLSITHRLTGLTAADAGELADLVREKLPA
ncbi:MAG TPA: hypothetical protein VIU61_30800 [Kofleriaceae bacterium]